MQENSRKRQKYYFDILILVVVSGLVIFPALGQERYLASREIRHAEIIREMAERGDYLVPRLFGKIYYDKPPVIHAPAAFITRIVGKPSMTIARMPSAIAGMLGVLATYGIGLLLLDRRSALVGAIVLLGMPGYSLWARHARPDMIFCAMILFSCLCLGIGMRKYNHFPRTFYFTLAGLFAGVGVITKGPYGILVPIFFVVFAPFRNLNFTRPRLGWTGFLLGLLTAIAIWAIPAYLRDGGEYLRGVIFQPDLDVTREGSVKSFFWYVPYVLILTVPLSIFLPLAIVDLRRYGYSAPLAIAGAMFIVISCISKKRQHYLLPLDPFLALGIAATVVRHGITSRIVRRSARILIIISIASIPIYFVAIQPFLQPYKNSKIFFAKEVLGVIKPNSCIYCVSGTKEVLAWVGRDYDRICEINRNDPSVTKTLCNDKARYYLVSEQDLMTLLKGKEPLSGELILNRKVGHENMMLFCLKSKTTGAP
ncbi:MAG: phospholipid carrier-dependent glycosyltransferase [Candidatus Brocadia sp.]|nr:phospholipid carrier-dependent glycosyltransferase [Candidatus Brocadia sp.]